MNINFNGRINLTTYGNPCDSQPKGRFSFFLDNKTDIVLDSRRTNPRIISPYYCVDITTSNKTKINLGEYTYKEVALKLIDTLNDLISSGKDANITTITNTDGQQAILVES